MASISPIGKDVVGDSIEDQSTGVERPGAETVGLQKGDPLEIFEEWYAEQGRPGGDEGARQADARGARQAEARGARQEDAGGARQEDTGGAKQEDAGSADGSDFSGFENISKSSLDSYLDTASDRWALPTPGSEADERSFSAPPELENSRLPGSAEIASRIGRRPYLPSAESADLPDIYLRKLMALERGYRKPKKRRAAPETKPSGIVVLISVLLAIGLSLCLMKQWEKSYQIKTRAPKEVKAPPTHNLVPPAQNSAPPGRMQPVPLPPTDVRPQPNVVKKRQQKMSKTTLPELDWKMAERILRVSWKIIKIISDEISETGSRNQTCQSGDL